MYTTLVSLLALTGTAFASRCANHDVPAEVMQQAKVFGAEARSHNAALQRVYAERTLEVDLYFHVVARDQTVEGGWIEQAKLDEQYKVLNEGYASMGVHFNLKNTSWTVNKEWAEFEAQDPDYDDPIDKAMKETLRQGPYAALNIYFRPFSQGSNLLGICVFPAKVTKGDKVFYKDGCQVLSTSVPGGSMAPYNEGKTATHEVGHWFGLFHTFQGGCAGGDEVDDTPAESSPASGCPKTRDTCTGAKYPGVDPVHNFMDYSDDPCLNQFSAGQAVRLYQFWDQFRAPSLTEESE